MLNEPIKFEFMGSFCITQGQRKIKRFRTYKTGVLIAYLAYYHQRSHPREELIEMLWTECDPALGRNSLSQSLSSLRRQLEPPGVASGEVLQADRYNIQLNLQSFTSDVIEFEEACQSFQNSDQELDRRLNFSKLSELYSGEFLPGFYEDWNLRERDRLQNLFLKQLSKRIEQIDQEEDFQTAVEYLQKAISIDPLNEEIHLRLMNLYVINNKFSQARQQFEDLTRILRKELDITPSAEAQALIESLQHRSLEPVRQHIQNKTVNRPNKAPPSQKMPSSGIFTMLAITLEEPIDKDELRKLIKRFEGHLFEDRTDIISATYANVSDAFSCAIKIQSVFDKNGLQKDRLPRIALSLGEIKSNQQSKNQTQRRTLLEQTLALIKSSHPGQFLCSEAASVLLLNNLEPNVRLSELGSYRINPTDQTERIYQAEYKTRPAQNFPGLTAKTANETTLPLQLSRFFGRETETQILSEWLVPDNQETRLVTLTGPGGTGKTRLSLEVAGKLQEDYQNAVWFVPLAPIKEPRFIPNAILEAMRLEAPVSASSMDFLISNLTGNKSLLVLDNFEQLLSEASPSLAKESTSIIKILLERVPDLRCFITSRRRLGIFGEKEFFLKPLPVPFEKDTIEEIHLCESVKMLIDRAQTVRPTFQLTKNNAKVIANLCRSLEGIPLALELAAAQLQVMTPSQIRKSLSRRLDFLTDRRHQAEERHQQLRATIDWSFQMLPADVRKFFAGLSIFRDGANLTDVEAICDDPLALDHLALLQEFSFLRVEENKFADDMRFQLLETLREYGAEKLDENQRLILRGKHAQNFVILAEQAEPLLRSENQTIWLQRLEQDHQNFLFALDWFLEAEDIENGLRLACGVCRFWEIRGHLVLGREKFDRLLNSQKFQTVAPEIRIKALSGAGDLALTAWDFSSAQSFFSECLKICRQYNDIAGEAEALRGLGRTAYEQGDYKPAYKLFQECLELSQILEDDFGAAALLNSLGLIASEQGDYEIAVKHYQESLDLRRRMGDKTGIATQLNNLGIINRRRGNYREAKAAFKESLAIRRELGDRRNISASLSNLSWVAENEREYEASRAYQEESFNLRQELGDEWGNALSYNIFGILARHQGDDVAAQNYFEKSLKIRRRLGNKLGIAETLHRLGDLLCSQGKFAIGKEYLQESLEFMFKTNNRLGLSEVLEAYSRVALKKEQYQNSTRLFFAAKSLRQSIGAVATPSEQAIHKPQIKRLKSILSKKDFQAAKNEGLKMSVKKAVDLASKI